MEEFTNLFGQDDLLAGFDDPLNPMPAGMGVLGNWDNMDADDLSLDPNLGFSASEIPIDTSIVESSMELDSPPPLRIVSDVTEMTESDVPQRPPPQQDIRLGETQFREDGFESDDNVPMIAGDVQPSSSDNNVSRESILRSSPISHASMANVSSIQIVLPKATIDPDEYFEPESPSYRITHIIHETESEGEPQYTINFEDGTLNRGVPAAQVEEFPNGKRLLKQYLNKKDNRADRRKSANDFYHIDDDIDRRKRRRIQKSILDFTQYEDDEEEDDESDDILSAEPIRRSARVLRPRNDSYKKNTPDREMRDTTENDGRSDEEEFLPIVLSDIAPRGRGRYPRKKPSKVTNTVVDSESGVEYEVPRRSERFNKMSKNMSEVFDDNFEEYRSPGTETVGAPKVISMKEMYKPTPQEFQDFHDGACSTCGNYGNNFQKGPLIFCQGCSHVFHKNCLGYRNAREHIVTKVDEDDFVLQCRFCVGVYKKKDPMAPAHDMCQGCKKKGVSCHAFSEKKSSRQEEKIRIENGGIDPITWVDPKLLNNPRNVLFRCVTCHRGFHFECLPPRWAKSDNDFKASISDRREKRLSEYASDYKCKDCGDMVNKIDTLVAWRPMDRNAYQLGQTCLDLDEDSKEYLVKWAKKSHYHCVWAPGAWVFGVAPPNMRGAFYKRNEGENLEPKFDEKDAIPEEYLLIDIILRVKYTVGEGLSSSKEDDMEKIDNVSNIFVKFQGLGYDNAVWDVPPTRDSGPFWAAFEAAYLEYLNGKHFKSDSMKTIYARISKFRKAPFKALTVQPNGLVRGQLMEYQLEGVDWLRYNYWREHSVILADEMGLGKTIQVIGLVTSLVQQEPRCFPFLVVVPNSTCPNWRREFQQWAPGVRVVSYHGGREPQELIYNHELFPERRGAMKAHVVVMSYDSVTDDRTRALFKHINWAGLVVDEGQRLKNDRNQLYTALRGMRIPWRLLLTGTPLQNNKRELFNLLQFIDTSKDAASLDEEYAELTAENIPKLHDLIRPYFLRRTKAQVLKFLPPMAQIIVPVTMSILQERLSRSILAKNPFLLKSLFARSGKMRVGDRGSLNNILIQLRKCLCHPFVYSRAIEEKNVDPETMQRNLIEASSKLVLLSIMLPKLKEQGHRVLMFSQFLDNLDLIEDFLASMGFMFQRLDGSNSSLEKQKRIDAFNAPESPYFAFLLSTRAGGVGINLATADTVIIMDPDFNPHQDLQALSRAHRIGQKNKVLCIQIVTKNSVEEKIMQIGRKKMALDHALIESMEDKDITGNDLESVLKHGAETLFSTKETDRISYDEATIEKLLDRSQIVDGENGDNSTENCFSFARVWEHEKGVLGDCVIDSLKDGEVDKTEQNTDIWEKILQQREQDALAEAAQSQQLLGRGGRRRQAVTYTNVVDKKHKSIANSDVDEDYHQSNEEDEDEAGDNQEAATGGSVSNSLPPISVVSSSHPTGPSEHNAARILTAIAGPPASYSLPQRIAMDQLSGTGVTSGTDSGHRLGPPTASAMPTAQLIPYRQHQQKAQRRQHQPRQCSTIQQGPKVTPHETMTQPKKRGRPRKYPNHPLDISSSTGSINSLPQSTERPNGVAPLQHSPLEHLIVTPQQLLLQRDRPSPPTAIPSSLLSHSESSPIHPLLVDSSSMSPSASPASSRPGSALNRGLEKPTQTLNTQRDQSQDASPICPSISNVSQRGSQRRPSSRDSEIALRLQLDSLRRTPALRLSPRRNSGGSGSNDINTRKAQKQSEKTARLRARLRDLYYKPYGK